MLGAITGDIVGSIYERHNIKHKNFELFTRYNIFTDDTVLTVATAEALLTDLKFSWAYEKYYYKYPRAGYGGNFHRWASSRVHEPYNSWGNGSAMRVSPVAWYYNDLETVLSRAKESAECTHNHSEGIKGAQSVAMAIFMARQGSSKEQIKVAIESKFAYDLSFELDEIRPVYGFDVSCQGSVPQAIRSFYESVDFEDAIRNAISIGGDSDTIAAIAGSIAEAYYGIPDVVEEKTFTYLDDFLKETIHSFREQLNKAGG